MIDMQREVHAWVDKHNTVPEVRWAIVYAHASIESLTKPDGIDDPYELAVWQARLPLIKTKALILGTQLRN